MALSTDLSFLNFTTLLKYCADEKRLIKYLQLIQIIPMKMTCSKCGNPNMTLHEHKDGDSTIHEWKCQKRIFCNHTESLFKGTWFSSSKLSLTNIMQLVYFIMRLDAGNSEVAGLVGVSKRTTSSWRPFLQNVLEEWCLQETQPIGGPKRTVEIYEYKFNYHRHFPGHFLEGQRIFGGIDPKSGAVFLAAIESVDGVSVMNFIREWVLPGTRIVSNCWSSPAILQEEDVNNLRIKHSIKFVVCENVTSANTIESKWRDSKSFYFLCRPDIDDYFSKSLCKQLFLHHCTQMTKCPFGTFLQFLGNLDFPDKVKSCNENDDYDGDIDSDSS